MSNLMQAKKKNPWKYLKHLNLSATPMVKKGDIMISTEEHVDLTAVDAAEQAKILGVLSGLQEFKHSNVHRLHDVAALIEGAI